MILSPVSCSPWRPDQPSDPTENLRFYTKPPGTIKADVGRLVVAREAPYGSDINSFLIRMPPGRGPGTTRMLRFSKSQRQNSCQRVSKQFSTFTADLLPHRYDLLLTESNIFRVFRLLHSRTQTTRHRHSIAPQCKVSPVSTMLKIRKNLQRCVKIRSDKEPDNLSNPSSRVRDRAGGSVLTAALEYPANGVT